MLICVASSLALVRRACERGKALEEAELVFRDMRDAGLQGDTVTYTALIAACARVGQWERALALVEEMKELGVTRNVVTYSALLRWCLESCERLVALLLENEFSNHQLSFGLFWAIGTIPR